MATKRNVFTPDSLVFLDGCGDLFHLLSFTYYRTKDIVKKIDAESSQDNRCTVDHDNRWHANRLAQAQVPVASSPVLDWLRGVVPA